MEEVQRTEIRPLQPLQPAHCRHSRRYQHDEILPEFTSPVTQSSVKETWSIEKELNSILSNISSIQYLQTQITIATSKQQELELISSRDTIMNLTRNLLSTTKDKIKSLEKENLKTIGPSTEDIEFRNQRIIHIKEKFINCLETYKSIEGNYVRQQKERLIRQFKIVNPEADIDEIEEYLDSSSGQPVFINSIMDSINPRKRLEDSKNVLGRLNKRHSDIKKIEKTIAELVELFKEMQLQVETQDDVIIQIADNVEVTENNTREVTAELAQAEVSAKSARKFKRILALIALLMIGIIILLVFLISSNNRRSRSRDELGGGNGDIKGRFERTWD